MTVCICSFASFVSAWMIVELEDSIDARQELPPLSLEDRSSSAVSTQEVWPLTSSVNGGLASSNSHV